VANYQPAPADASLLALLRVSEAAYRSQTAGLDKALTKLQVSGVEPGHETLLADGFRDPISIKTGAWIKNKPIGKGLVARLWFQLQIGAIPADGALGPNSKQTFVDAYGAALARRQQLAKVLAGDDTAAIDKTLAEHYQDPAYQEDLISLGLMLCGSGDSDSQLMINELNDKPFRLEVDLAGPAGGWALANRGKQSLTLAELDSSVRLLWVARKEGLARSDGTFAGELRTRINPFGEATATQIYDTGLAAWRDK